MESSSSSMLSSYPPAGTTTIKRPREAEAEEAAEGKRLRPEDLLDLLDDVADADAAAADLASVMRSLQDEISADADVQPELGFLLEASDDELGLPPAAAAAGTSSYSSDDNGAGWEDQHAFGAQIWGFEDDIDGYGGGYVASSPEAAAAAAAAAAEWGDDGFDAGLFAFGADDGSFGASDLDAMRHHETMPAV